MSRGIIAGLAVVLLLLPTLMVRAWIGSAAVRLAEAERAADAEPEQVAVAANANEAYCTADLKKILRRVLTSCGLINASGRGCQPLDAKNVATMTGADFNALFLPMQGRGGIIQYDKNATTLDAIDTALVDKVFADRRGASYFLVVSRASPEGSEGSNRELSRGRADAVLNHLQTTFNDPELAKQVGLLWLGEEYAQLEQSFCSWQRSGSQESCLAEELNRSAFITWIDCTL
jgi:outer membrane protein OmpA-like peptidoglycan-associated protein